LAAYGQWVAQVCRQDNLPHFDRAGSNDSWNLARVGLQTAKNFCCIAEITDLVRERRLYGRGKSRAKRCPRSTCKKAIDQRAFRSNRIEKKYATSSPKAQFSLTLTVAKLGTGEGH